MMWLISVALFLGLVSGNDVRKLCKGMVNKECQKIGSEIFNYTAEDIRRMTPVMRQIMENRIACKIEGECPTVLPSSTRADCVGGMADQWSCDKVNLLAFIPLLDLGSSSSADGNDIWG